MGGIKAIQTRYKGYHFRSRLEARWAVFFEVLGVKWEYEPQGFELPDGTRYLPDFRVVFRDETVVWYEVKPSGDPPSKKMLAFARAFCKQDSNDLFVGARVWHAEFQHGDVLALEAMSTQNPRVQVRFDFWPDDPKWLVIPFANLQLIDGKQFQGFKTVCGDPYEVLQRYGGDWVKFGHDYNSLWTAAEAARSARFEFGQSGAKAA